MWCVFVSLYVCVFVCVCVSAFVCVFVCLCVSVCTKEPDLQRRAMSATQLSDLYSGQN